MLTGCTSHDEIMDSLKKILVQNEESRLLQDEYQALQESYTQITGQLKTLENEKIKMAKEIKDKDLLINAAPSNFTKNLLAQKDGEIHNLKAELATLRDEKDSIEENLWRTQRDLGETKETLSNQISGLTNDLEAEKEVQRKLKEKLKEREAEIQAISEDARDQKLQMDQEQRKKDKEE